METANIQTRQFVKSSGGYHHLWTEVIFSKPGLPVTDRILQSPISQKDGDIDDGKWLHAVEHGLKWAWTVINEAATRQS